MSFKLGSGAKRGLGASSEGQKKPPSHKTAAHVLGHNKKAIYDAS
jgi:hypothetical protein